MTCTTYLKESLRIEKFYLELL